MKAIRESVTLLCLLAPAAWLALHWQVVPYTLPSHFNAVGQVNAYAPRSVLWLLVGIQATLYLLLLVITWFPRLFNLPAGPGASDRVRMEALAIDMLGWIRLEIVVVFDYLLWMILRIAQQRASGLGAGFTAAPAAAILLTVIWFSARMKRGGV